MKSAKFIFRRLLPCCALLIGLSACGAMFDREYYVEEPYEAGYVELMPNSGIREVHNYTGMREALELFVSEHSETGTIHTNNYIGVVEDDISRAVNSIVRESPLGVYAVDYIRQDTRLILSYYEITLRINYKRSLEETSQIVPLNNQTQFFSALDELLIDFQSHGKYEFTASSLTEQNIIDYIERRHNLHPEVLPVMPAVRLNAYPGFESLRKLIIVDINYGHSREWLLAECMFIRQDQRKQREQAKAEAEAAAIAKAEAEAALAEEEATAKPGGES
ncbi:MAG: hypothetical protein LBM98_06145 [Oscillospiraceae bacterium]|jgi:hypothetical protein|nr:hypothetical protein [Oscillospiraceae bacterium]